MNNQATKIVTLPIHPNSGYNAEQVSSRMTLADLAEMIQDAIEKFGEDSVVVTHDLGNRYGANFGRIDQFQDIELVENDDEDGEEEE